VNSNLHFLWIAILSLSIGVDRFYAQFLSLETLKAVPLSFFVCTAFLICHFKRVRINPVVKVLIFLLCWGMFLGVFRYFLFYHPDFFFHPIVRQALSFGIGVVQYVAFSSLLLSFSFKEISTILVASSVPFLALGLYQLFTDHFVGQAVRAVGLFSEPSYFGDYLLIIIAPSFLFLLYHFKSFTSIYKYFLVLYTLLFTVNTYATQSGTALLKILTLLFLFFFLLPKRKKWIALPGILAGILGGVFLYSKEGYFYATVNYGLNIIKNPDLFLKYHTFYDRFYPIYSSIKFLSSPEGIVGTGFGGDYFDFKNLFPPSTHEEMILSKPTLSFFNSFASKIILYLGFLGAALLASAAFLGRRIKNLFIRVGFYNVLLASLWGIANFSTPYIWWWASLILNKDRD
jgi:hypothetical protein